MAVSPDRPEKLAESKRAEGLGYTLLSHSLMRAAQAYGIAFRLSDEDEKAYRGYGVDLAGASGQTHQQLPVPSVFLIDGGGTVRWVYSNPDYEVRPDNDTVLEAARKIAAES